MKQTAYGTLANKESEEMQAATAATSGGKGGEIE